MKRKDLMQEIALRLKKMRRYFGHSAPNMANKLHMGKSSYYRNEAGRTAPDIQSCYLIGKELGISLNWLILDRGEMLYKKEAAIKESKPDLENLEPDVFELLEHMRKIPLLHYELLAHFHRFKQEHGSLVEKEMKK